MKIFISHICLLASVILICLSCAPEVIPDDDTDIVPECHLLYEGKETDMISLDNASARLELLVMSNVPWSIKAENPDWMSFSINGGEASEVGETVVLTLEENTTSFPRQTYVVLTAGSALKRMLIAQKPSGSAPAWESSYEAVRNMGVGWNLGNTLDADAGTEVDGSDWRYWETCWGQPVTRPELMTMMKNAGFGAMRVPVTWRPHMSPDGHVSEAWMNRVREIVDYVIGAGMYCIINVHHDTGAGDDVWLLADPDIYDEQRDRYEYLWRQIAEEFRDYDHRLLFESYNEMLDSRKSWCFASFNGGYDSVFAKEAYDAINSYAQSFVNVVRSTGGNNSVRNLIVNTYGACCGSDDWSPYLKDPLKYMKLPEDTVKDHLIFEVHAYPMIDDMASMPSETSELFAGLDHYLASKGAPVIMGEWGTFSENPPLEDVLTFADCFVRTAKSYKIATFFWMGLSDGLARQYPAFSQPDLAQTIVNAYHGDTSSYIYPTFDDFDTEYIVTYETQWAEMNLCDRTISLDEYSGISFELGEKHAGGELAVKFYGESDGMEQYTGVDSVSPTVYFDASALGSSVRRMTLQFMKEGTYSASVRNVELLRHDGTREPVGSLSVFWGCSIELVCSPK